MTRFSGVLKIVFFLFQTAQAAKDNDFREALKELVNSDPDNFDQYLPLFLELEDQSLFCYYNQTCHQDKSSENSRAKRFAGNQTDDLLNFFLSDFVKHSEVQVVHLTTAYKSDGLPQQSRKFSRYCSDLGILFAQITLTQQEHELPISPTPTPMFSIFIFLDDDFDFNWFLDQLKLSNISSSDYLILIQSTEPEVIMENTTIGLKHRFYTFHINKTTEIVKIREHYRVPQILQTKSLLYGIWNANHGLVTVKSNLWERRRDLQGIVLDVGFRTDIPFLYRYRYKTETPDRKNRVHFLGYIPDLWRELERTCNFSSKLVRSIDRAWGVLQEDGTFNGLVGMLQRREIDVGLSAFQLTQPRSRVVDFLGPFGIIESGLYIKRGDGEGEPMSFLSPLALESWTLLFVVSLTSCLVLALTLIVNNIMDPENEDNQENEILFSLMLVIHCFFGQGTPNEPRPTSSKVAFFCTFLSVVILLSAYSASLTSLLAVKRQDYPFHSLKTLHQREEYNLLTVAGTSYVDMFKFGNEVQRKLYQEGRIEVRNSTIGAIFALATQPKKVMIWSKVLLESLSARLIPCIFRQIPGFSRVQKMTSHLQKDSPYTDLFNYQLAKMEQTGILRRLWLRHIKDSNTDFCNVHGPEEPLGIVKLSAMFVMLSYVLVLTLVLVFFEVCFYAIYKKIKKNINISK